MIPFSKPVIVSRNLSKAYALFNRPEDRLKQMFFGNRRRYYQEFWALKNVDLEVWPGEAVGLIGRNGSGKSTFLRMIAGTLVPTAGELSIQGKIAPLLELGSGFNPEFTGHENIHLCASILGLSKAQINDRYQSILEFAGLGDFIQRPVKIYSDGMHARLGFAISAHVDADILIIDEILAVGDVEFRQKCLRFLTSFKKKGTLLFVTHDPATVLGICDRAVWFEKGEVQKLGPAKEVCESYLAFAESSERKGCEEAVLSGPLHGFNPKPQNESFGVQGARIINVALHTLIGEPLFVCRGGEPVVLTISVKVVQPIHQPIVGFFVKDRLGQRIFGDNTYKACQLQPRFEPGDVITAEFSFEMPFLLNGDFTFDVAIAEGTQENHTVHHWKYDALGFRVIEGSAVYGLVRVPMRNVRLTLNDSFDRKDPTMPLVS